MAFFDSRSADTQAQEALLDETAVESDAEASTKEKYDALYDQYVRMAADFDNFRKRNAQEQLSWRKYAAEGTISALIPVLDNLDRAGSTLSEASEPKLLHQSLRMMSSQLTSTLETIGVKRMQPVGQPFDPMQHDAVSQAESPEVPEGYVIAEELAGYLLYDRVIRPASVKVSTGQAKTASPDAGTASDLSQPGVNPFTQSSLS
ncbi:MAG: nucleotide exchange factor GrpE [Vampirovibrionales bacterium]|nr:nucleotide exchange factor GrpE [Vampirovibrionales bacterium]